MTTPWCYQKLHKLRICDDTIRHHIRVCAFVLQQDCTGKLLEQGSSHKINLLSCLNIHTIHRTRLGYFFTTKTIWVCFNINIDRHSMIVRILIPNFLYWDKKYSYKSACVVFSKTRQFPKSDICGSINVTTNFFSVCQQFWFSNRCQSPKTLCCKYN